MAALVADAAVAAAGTYGAVAATKVVAAAALPSVMSATGTVVAGVGTMHGVLTPIVASFAATPVGWVPLLVGAAWYTFF
eukprot:m.920331 g.920331  ORF g.920331 m.920331 type:complete len:79 (-) comp63556_c0_seq1:87-323(-)